MDPLWVTTRMLVIRREQLWRTGISKTGQALGDKLKDAAVVRTSAQVDQKAGQVSSTTGKVDDIGKTPLEGDLLPGKQSESLW